MNYSDSPVTSTVIDRQIHTFMDASNIVSTLHIFDFVQIVVSASRFNRLTSVLRCLPTIRAWRIVTNILGAVLKVSIAEPCAIKHSVRNDRIFENDYHRQWTGQRLRQSKTNRKIMMDQDCVCWFWRFNLDVLGWQYFWTPAENFVPGSLYV